MGNFERKLKTVTETFCPRGFQVSDDDHRRPCTRQTDGRPVKLPRAIVDVFRFLTSVFRPADQRTRLPVFHAARTPLGTFAVDRLDREGTKASTAAATK